MWTALRKLPIHPITSLLLLLMTVILLARGLGEVVNGATWSAFIPVGVTAALVGWGCGSRRFKGWQAWGGIIILGIVLLGSSTAQLGGPLLQLAESLPPILRQAFLWIWNHKVELDFSAAASAWSNIVMQSLGLWQHILQWAQGLQHKGSAVYDPVINVLAWSLLLWLAITWEGWFMRRGQVLIATAPSLALLGEVIYNTATDMTPLWSLLSVTLLLMGLMRFETILLSWIKRGIDYAEIILDTTVSITMLVTFLLVITAWAVPSFSIQRIIDMIHEYEQAQKISRTTSLAQTFGLKTAQPPKENSANPALSYGLASVPKQHRIGAGPKLSHNLVMTIGTGELPAISNVDLTKLATRYHWRTNIFDVYTGNGWASGHVEGVIYPADSPLFAQIPQHYRVLHQNVTLINPKDKRLYWAGTLYQVDQPTEVGWRTYPYLITGPSIDIELFSQADLLGALSPAKSYNVDSLLPVANLAELRAAPAAYPEIIRRRYLQLPTDIPERVLELARNLTATAPTPYDRAKVIESYLRKTYPYTLDVPAPPDNVDVVDYFLFDLKKGFCDYYASSMVVLARAAGLPARMVFGYASGTFNASTARYSVTEADAHAWVEIYFADIGWVEFEPTASVEEFDQPSEEHQIVANPNIESPPLVSNRLDMIDQGLSNFILWVALISLGLAALMVVIPVGEFWLLTRIPTARAMQVVYRGLYRLGRNVAGPTLAGAGETPGEFAALLQAGLKNLSGQRWLQKLFTPAPGELSLLTKLYIRALYTPHPPKETEMRMALHVWQVLRWRLVLAMVVPAMSLTAKIQRLMSNVLTHIQPGQPRQDAVDEQERHDQGSVDNNTDQ